MSRLRDVVIVLGDFDRAENRIHRYLNAVSRDYDIVRIDDAVIEELKPDELPLDILVASICDLVISQYPSKVFRLLLESRFLTIGFTISKHLIGRDLNVEFIGVFDGSEPVSINAMNADSLCFPVHYIVESSGFLKSPSHWKVCDLSTPDETKAFKKFCETLNSSKDSVFSEISYQPLFSIQNSRSNNAPVFCIPGAGDNIACFTAMCMALGPDYAIYGMQPRGLDGRMIPHHSVEAAAASYIDSIKKAQKKGSIHLVGHSFGGWVAFEIAATIARRQDLDITVASLTVIDSEVPGAIKCGSEYSDNRIIENYIESIELYSKKRASIQLQDWDAINQNERVRRLHEAMVGIGILPARTSPDILLGPYNTFSTAFRTFYSPIHRYTKELRLVLAPDEKLTNEQNEAEYLRISQGWEKYAHDLKVFYGGGNHIKILSEPYIHEVIGWWDSQNQNAGVHSLPTTMSTSRKKQGYAIG